MGAPNPSGEGAPGGGRGKSAKGVNSVRKTPKVRHIHPKRCAKSKNPVSFSVSRFFGECFALSAFFSHFSVFSLFPHARSWGWRGPGGASCGASPSPSISPPSHSAEHIGGPAPAVPVSRHGAYLGAHIGDRFWRALLADGSNRF